MPAVAVVLRKAYRLGAMAMAASGLHAPLATAAWPSGKLEAMGLEGAVELGYRKEPESAATGDKGDELHQRLVAESHEKGKALNLAATFEIDAVIGPGDTRDWLVRVLAAAPVPPASCRFIDPW